MTYRWDSDAVHPYGKKKIVLILWERVAYL